MKWELAETITISWKDSNNWNKQKELKPLELVEGIEAIEQNEDEMKTK